MPLNTAGKLLIKIQEVKGKITMDLISLKKIKYVNKLFYYKLKSTGGF